MRMARQKAREYSRLARTLAGSSTGVVSGFRASSGTSTGVASSTAMARCSLAILRSSSWIAASALSKASWSPASRACSMAVTCWAL